MAAISWPEQPFRLITTTHDAADAATLSSGAPAAVRVSRLMALTHNTIFRALNAIYVQCVAVKPENEKDVRDLATFASFALDFLDNHHTVEETVFFPMVEAQTGIPGLMDTNVQQHRDFDAALGSLREYVEQLKMTALLDAGELRRRIEALAGPLEKHLKDEIPTLLAIGKILDNEKMETCYKAMHDEAEGTTDPYKCVIPSPYTLRAVDLQ